MPPTQYPTHGLLPAFDPADAIRRTFALPYGSSYPQGQAIGVIGGTAQNEIATLTISGSPTGGTFAVSFAADKVYQTTGIAYNATLAAFQAAVEAAVPEWAGNTQVTGTPGVSYVLTLVNLLANQRVDGTLAANPAGLAGGTSPAAAWVRTQKGSCGPAQAAPYDAALNNRVDGFLEYDTTLTPGGARVPTAAVPAYGQPHQPAVFVSGFFYDGPVPHAAMPHAAASKVVGLDANAYTLNTLTKVQGLYLKLN